MDTPDSSPNLPIGPIILKRGPHGLYENIPYSFEESGHVNWRSMINPKFLYPNKGWFERNNKAVPDSIENLEDHQLLCKLGGYKELARLRGFESVSYKLEYLENGVSCICTINWIGNYETGPVSFSSIANSTSENCGEFMAAFKETQAENRAFVRCVRNFLNINIVGDDEISKGVVVSQTSSVPTENSPDALNPLHTLKSIAQKKGFENFKKLKSDFLAPKKFKPKSGSLNDWETIDNVPTNEYWRIIAALNE